MCQCVSLWPASVERGARCYLPGGEQLHPETHALLNAAHVLLQALAALTEWRPHHVAELWRVLYNNHNNYSTPPTTSLNSEGCCTTTTTTTSPPHHVAELWRVLYNNHNNYNITPPPRRWTLKGAVQQPQQLQHHPPTTSLNSEGCYTTTTTTTTSPPTTSLNSEGCCTTTTTTTTPPHHVAEFWRVLYNNHNNYNTTPPHHVAELCCTTTTNNYNTPHHVAELWRVLYNHNHNDYNTTTPPRRWTLKGAVQPQPQQLQHHHPTMSLNSEGCCTTTTTTTTPSPPTMSLNSEGCCTTTTTTTTSPPHHVAELWRVLYNNHNNYVAELWRVLYNNHNNYNTPPPRRWTLKGAVQQPQHHPRTILRNTLSKNYCGNPVCLQEKEANGLSMTFCHVSKHTALKFSQILIYRVLEHIYTCRISTVPRQFMSVTNRSLRKYILFLISYLHHPLTNTQSLQPLVLLTFLYLVSWC